MFNQQEYVNEYLKDKYKTLKLRIRNDDKILFDWISSVDNINQYLTDLIWKDISEHSEFNYINSETHIDFELSKTMRSLVIRAEKADLLGDYGLYMNLADAIDSQAKYEVTHHIITETEWGKLSRRYCI